MLWNFEHKKWTKAFISLFVGFLHGEKRQHLDNSLNDLSVMETFLCAFAPLRWLVCRSGLMHTFKWLWNPKDIRLKYHDWCLYPNQKRKKTITANSIFNILVNIQSCCSFHNSFGPLEVKFLVLPCLFGCCHRFDENILGLREKWWCNSVRW